MESFVHDTFNFQNNLINWIVLAVLLCILWKRMMPAIFAARRTKIETLINDAARDKEDGRVFLEAQKQRIGNAEKEAEQILVEAKNVANQMKQQMADQTKKDAADLEVKLTQQIETQRQMVITELRSTAATVAVGLAQASLPGAITPAVKQGLQERFIQQLDTIGTKN